MFFIWQDEKEKREMIHFLFGQAKLAIYYSRKQKIDSGQAKECVATFKGLVKARILLNFKYYEEMKDLDSFKNIWDVDGVLFSFVDGDCMW